MPPASESKTICWPSGDQRGPALEVPDKEVRAAACEPSRFAVQTCVFPFRLETKATRLPSGENCGKTSRREEERDRSSEAVRVGRSTCQRFASTVPAT